MESIWKTIYNQIGNQAFRMLGASNFLYEAKNPTWLSFRIKGSKKVNYIKVSYNEGLDLYQMELGKIFGGKYRIIEILDEVYFDMLNEMIEEYTGLYTSL